MQAELIQKVVIEQLLPESAAEKIRLIMEKISAVQRGLYLLAVSDDSEKLNLLKIGTVFQIFFIDTLASGKRPQDLKAEDWKGIYEKVLKYAVLEEGQTYSEFVFTLYADYIVLSAVVWKDRISSKSYDAISGVASSIRQNTEAFHNGEIKETEYVEACLWLSLEAMIKLLSASLAVAVGPDLADLAAAVSQLGFEYGRYVLYRKEQALLEEYLENQRVLDERLKKEYDAFLTEVNREAEQFQHLIDDAFSPDLHEALLQSAALARASGVDEKEILTSVADIDEFFM